MGGVGGKQIKTNIQKVNVIEGRLRTRGKALLGRSGQMMAPLPKMGRGLVVKMIGPVVNVLS